MEVLARIRAAAGRMFGEIVIGDHLAPLGLTEAMAEYIRPLDVRCTLAVIELRLVRALRGLGVRSHEIQPARLIDPKKVPVSGHFRHHPGLVVSIWRLVDEIPVDRGCDLALPKRQGLRCSDPLPTSAQAPG